MPELPEVENARQVVEKALGRVIVDIDDTDSFECRPHMPGDIAHALKGGKLTEACRRGKAMWCETVTADGSSGPTLGIHLGMGGRVIVTA
ncbi:MAG: DNA-formamidopyrimidine glycosylase family protein, partial [Rhodococcus sp. (in: high G+C Gram-positive bacteria)]